jgi:hypothetical protein
MLFDAQRAEQLASETAPITPVMMTSTVLSAGSSLRFSDTAMAIGVLADLAPMGASTWPYYQVVQYHDSQQDRCDSACGQRAAQEQDQESQIQLLTSDRDR